MGDLRRMSFRIEFFFKPWSDLMWVALKVVLLTCSASSCEQNCIVRTHTNLKLEQGLQLDESGLFPWDIEMTVEESWSDDEDGAPHSVSDSESESESEKDSD